MPDEQFIPGLVVLMGSGETAASGGSVYDLLAAKLQGRPRIALLETPAGFQPNSALVAERVADFMRVRLQNARPELTLVAARQRGTPCSPDAPEVVAPLASADIIFMGPGSPTYTVRQLEGSLAWQLLCARHRRGAAIVAASAATVALGAVALPVYEIYKVGSDLHWTPGLDFLGAYGLSLALLPHWNNTEGGAELDTSHCFMGRERYQRLLTMLPTDTTVLGIDEHTALILDLEAGQGTVLGRGGATVLRNGREQHFGRKGSFPIQELGPFRRPTPHEGIDPSVWEQTAEQPTVPEGPAPPPADVLALLESRQAARANRDWAGSDALRDRILALGWRIRDTPAGPQLEPA